MKTSLLALAVCALATTAYAGESTFKGGKNSAHGQTYGSVNKAINESIRNTGSYTSVHSGTTYTKPGAGNRLSNGKGTRE